VDLGFRTEGLLTFSLPVPPDRLKDGEEIAAFYRELVDRVHAIPGVRSASVSTTLPLHASGFAVMTFDVAGAPPAEPSNRPAARLNVVSPGYFATFGIPLERGRGPGEQDRAGAPLVAVVNEAFVKRFLPDGDPLGRRLAIKRLRPGLKLAPAVDWEVVGVSRDVRNADARSEPVPEITVPFDQSPWPETAMAVRTSGAPASVKPGVAAAIRAMDPDLPMADVKTMVQVVNDSMASDRFNTVLFGGFAAMALLLAAVGIYALMSFAVAQRTHEIGLRMALGAGRAQVLREVLRDGMGTALLGTVVGAAGAWGVERLMRGMVYGVGGVDAAGFAAVASTLLGAALVACLVPARRAASVDPIAALRRQ
jgi:putative ABC transport system permease protein